jgi:hypothetical protein
MTRLINDIRLSGLAKLAQIIHELVPEQPKLQMRKYINVVERYFLMLLSVKFDSGVGNVFHLELDFDRPHGPAIPSWSGTCRVFKLGIDPETFAKYDDGLRQQFFINGIHSMLSFVAKNEGLNQEQIDWVRDQLLKFGDNLEITWVRKVTHKFDIKIAFTIDDVSRLLLGITEIPSGKFVNVKIIDLDEHTDALKLVSRVSIKDEAILIYPRKNDLGLSILKRYWQRLDCLGFHSDSLEFMSIPLRDLIKS